MPQAGERRTIDGQLAEWDGKGWAPVAEQPAATPRTWTDTAVDALPAIGGAIGGIGGTLAGLPTLGLGSVPGAIAGATVLGGGGEAAKQLINRWRGKPAPQTSGDAATQIGEQGAMQGAMEAGGQAAMPMLEKAGTAVYRGYLKPSLSKVNLSKAADIVKTAIDENLPMTHGGLARANDLIGQLNGKVNDILSNATGRTVDLGEVANDVRAWAKRMYDRPGRDPKDYEAVLNVADRIDPAKVPSMAGASADVALPVANQVKRDLQASAADKFGVPGVSAEVAGEKAASGMMRQAIEKQAPDVGAVNLRESKLIDVARALARATGRDANRDQIIGTRAIVGGLTGGALGGGASYEHGGSPSQTALTTAVGSLVGTLGLHPAVATWAAILAAKIGQTVPGSAVADVARAAVQAVLEQQGGETAQ
jgi:hypothetical protein